MKILKIIILIAGALEGIYCFYKGFKKMRTSGMEFNWKELFQNVAMGNTPSGNLLLYGTICFLAVLYLYNLWHI